MGDASLRKHVRCLRYQDDKMVGSVRESRMVETTCRFINDNGFTADLDHECLPDRKNRAWSRHRKGGALKAGEIQ
jgi:hypothetical protein